MSKRVKGKAKRVESDRWLKEHFEELIDKYTGEFIVVADGQIYRGGTPTQLREQAQREHPKSKIMGIRVPRPEDFLCALITL